MAFIAVDLRVIEGLAGQVARAADTSEDRVLAGLVRLWHRCWSTTSDTVTRPQLAGVMGGERLAEVASALVDLGFLDPVGDAWRVRGASRYLRLKASRKAGAEKTNAARSRATTSARSRASLSVAQASLPDALSPSTEHRAPNTTKEAAAVEPKESRPLQFDVMAPDSPCEAWTREEFWRWAEFTRRAAGCPPEKWPSPVALSRWWTDARGATDVEALKEAFLCFGDDDYWQKQKPALPWAGFASQWLQFLPVTRKAGRHAAS